ncbi:MAG: hypothetical protein KGH98_03690 [Candidatus Micrarchaeota archaeon]|nr:hypothetical protein [Candidatus Micrarchaeota archaeon]
MAKPKYPDINVRAAAITGAILGFLCWLLVIPYGAGYGMMGYMMGYSYGTSATYGMGLFHNYSPLSIFADIVLGAIAGAVIGIVYNWALRLRV